MRELKIAILGGGFMGRAHSLAYAVAPLAEDLGVSVVREVLVDPVAEVAESSAQQYGWNGSSTDWEEVVNRPDIDIVDICSPPQFHRDQALAAIAAGKHVFCEKPIANSAAEAIEMRDAAQAAGVVNQVGFNYRHVPAIAFAKQLMDKGELGAPLQFRGSYLQETGHTADPNRWRARKATGGSGMVGDIGSHVIDAAELLMGDIARVAARERSGGTRESGWADESLRISENRVDDGGVWVAEFANGAIGSFAASSFASGRKNRLAFELDGSLGSIDFDWNDREALRVSYIDEKPDHMGFRTIHTNNQHPNGWWRLAGLGTGYVEVSGVMLQKFIKAIVLGEAASPDFADAVHVQQVVDAIHEAALTNSWVEIEPRKPREAQ